MSARHVMQAFEDAQPIKPRGRDAPQARILTTGAGFLASIQPPQYAVRPILQRGHVVAMTALTGHGKTTCAHMLVAGVLTGRQIGGLKFKRGRVLFLVGENPPNTALQLRGALKRNAVPDTALTNLHVKEGADRLAGLIDDILREASGLGEFSLVVVDTSSAYFSYDDENDNVAAHQHAVDLRRLTELPGRPSVLVLCHPVKNAARDNLLPRGGGAFLNNLDGNLTLWSDGEAVTLHHGKFRGPPFDPIGLRMEPEDVGFRDDEGMPICPLVSVPLSDGDQAALDRKRNEDENCVLWAMLRAPTGAIADWARDAGWLSAAGQPLKSKVHRVLQRLAEDKLVRRYRGRWTLTEPGRKEAERVD